MGYCRSWAGGEGEGEPRRAETSLDTKPKQNKSAHRFENKSIQIDPSQNKTKQNAQFAYLVRLVNCCAGEREQRGGGVEEEKEENESTIGITKCLYAR